MSSQLFLRKIILYFFFLYAYLSVFFLLTVEQFNVKENSSFAHFRRIKQWQQETIVVFH